jgi:NADH:ubiquinone oxidoreductase subunit C
MNFNLNFFLGNYRNYLKEIFPQSLSYILNGELIIKIPLHKLSNIMFFLKTHSQSQFKVLSDICAVDYP